MNDSSCFSSFSQMKNLRPRKTMMYFKPLLSVVGVILKPTIPVFPLCGKQEGIVLLKIRREKTEAGSECFVYSFIIYN